MGCVRVAGGAASAEALLWTPPRARQKAGAGVQPHHTDDVNAILIFLSMLKASGIGAFTARAEFRTLCSIRMEKTQITAQLRKGFCFWLRGTYWLCFQEGAQRVFSFFFFFPPRYPQPPQKGPSLVMFPHPGKKMSLQLFVPVRCPGWPAPQHLSRLRKLP